MRYHIGNLHTRGTTKLVRRGSSSMVNTMIHIYIYLFVFVFVGGCWGGGGAGLVGEHESFMIHKMHKEC